MVNFIYTVITLFALIYGIGIGRKYEMKKNKKENDARELDSSNLRKELDELKGDMIEKDATLETLLNRYKRTIGDMETFRTVFEESNARKDADLKQAHERNLYLENIVRTMDLGPA